MYQIMNFTGSVIWIIWIMMMCTNYNENDIGKVIVDLFG